LETSFAAKSGDLAADFADFAGKYSHRLHRLHGFFYGFTVGILECLFRQSLNLSSMQASAFSLSALTVSWASQLPMKPSGVFNNER